MNRIHRLALATALVAGVSTVPLAAQQVFIHGYATQAYGQSSEFAQAGLGIDGTADLRAAALQARVMFFSTGTQIVAQGAHRRVGGSPIAGIVDDVELDWVFAEQRLGDFAVRVGRVPIPKGLVNEMRDVGTLLPFYQASKAFYTDGIETVDGATARYNRTFGGFDVEAQAFTGDIPIVISLVGNDGFTVIDEEGSQTFGGQLTIGLPLTGARMLAGMLDSDVWIQTEFGEVELDWEYQWAAVEYQAERAFARVEHSWSFVPSFQRSRSYYVQAGLNLVDRLWINGQREHTFTRVLAEPAVGYEYDPITDWAAGLSYRYSSKLVFKAEQHFSNGYSLDQAVSIVGPAAENRYFLFSVSAAF